METSTIASFHPNSNATLAWLPSFGATQKQKAKSHTRPIQSQPSRLRASPWVLSRTRRALDLAIALLVLAAFAIPMVLIAALVRLTSPGPAFFTQQRMGRGGKLFRVLKFRSMSVPRAGASGPGLTRDGDARITPLGKWLRKLKFDELPQFINVLRGEMSLVGPRPKLPKYEELRNMPYTPGITGAATLHFRNEEEMLRNVSRENLDAYYARHIQPLKAQLDAEYMATATWLTDLRLLSCTFLACLQPERVPSCLSTSADACDGLKQQSFETVH